jgi:hypothetical protein
MDVGRFGEEVRQQLLLAADASGDDVRAAAERLVAAVGPAVHLALLDALADAAAELTAELSPGSVELRLRGRDAAWAVTLPPADHAPDVPAEVLPATDDVAFDADDAELVRINLRLPKALKERVERAASRDGLSTNAWLVRAAAAATDPTPAPRPRRAASGGDHIAGWVR